MRKDSCSSSPRCRWGQTEHHELLLPSCRQPEEVATAESGRQEVGGKGALILWPKC